MIFILLELLLISKWKNNRVKDLEDFISRMLISKTNAEYQRFPKYNKV